MLYLQLIVLSFSLTMILQLPYAIDQRMNQRKRFYADVLILLQVALIFNAIVLGLNIAEKW